MDSSSEDDFPLDGEELVRSIIVTFAKAFGSLSEIGFENLYEQGYDMKDTSGVTFSIFQCGDTDNLNFEDLPYFDSNEFFSDDQIKEIRISARREWADYTKAALRFKAEREKESLRKRKEAKRQLNSITNLGKNEIEDVEIVIEEDTKVFKYKNWCFDVKNFLRTGVASWCLKSKLDCTCAVCLGLLKRGVMIEGYTLHFSRPSFDPDDVLETEYTTFRYEHEPFNHYVDWASEHGLNADIEVQHFRSCCPGFRHIIQQYEHKHYHYIKNDFYNDRYFLNKGSTCALGEYITACVIENIKKLSSRDKVRFRSLAGLWPTGPIYRYLLDHEMMSDLSHFKILFIIVFFGLRMKGDFSKKLVVKWVGILTMIIEMLNKQQWHYILNRDNVLIWNRSRKSYEKSWPEFLETLTFEELSISDDDYDDINS